MEGEEVIKTLEYIIRRQDLFGSNYDELYFGIKDLLDRMEGLE